MKRFLLLLIVCAFTMLAAGGAFAAHGHYVNGGEGLKAGTLPPPGFYYRMYNTYYTSGTYKNKYGKSVGDFSVDVFCMAHRFIYSTDIEILGGNFVVDMVIPLVQTDIHMAGVFENSRFGVSDILVEPFLIAWHGERWDSVIGVGLYLPTGYFTQHDKASPGKGFWTLMLSAGGTLYFDDAKSWHASVASRYEIHTEQKNSSVTPGNDFHFEWGVGKTLQSGFEFGLAGYCGWQVTEDYGRGSDDSRQDAFAVGPEVGYAFQDLGLQVSLRSLWEFENKAGSQGNVTSLVLTKAF